VTDRGRRRGRVRAPAWTADLRRALPAAALALGLIVAALGCGRGRSPVAHLLEGQGVVEREHAAKVAAAPNGQPFVLGDAARTGAGAWARLRLRGGSVLRMGPEARVRFLAAGARLELGDAIAEGGPVTVITEAGAAIIERGGVLRAMERDGRLRFEVVVGRAQLQRPEGALVLEVGSAVLVSVGGAIIERTGPGAPDAGAPTTAPDAGAVFALDAGADDAGADDVAAREPMPATVDVAIDPGARAVIHDPGGTVAVRVAIGDACADAAGAGLELADGSGSFARARRVDGAAFFARSGTTRFRVRCADGQTGRAGWLRVARDTGAAPVVRTPPRNRIETDGRRYAVSYQNRLPELDVGWSEASGPSTLHVLAAGGGERTFTASGAHRLASGTLDDGKYTLWITAGARSSPRTALAIAFDNAAPTAQITAPPPRAPWSDPLEVRGVTVEGWSVAVDGKPVGRDGSGRFRAEVAVGDQRVIAIRLAHPVHGVHYYLRRRE
jgi:hypothetical protein